MQSILLPLSDEFCLTGPTPLVLSGLTPHYGLSQRETAVEGGAPASLLSVQINELKLIVSSNK